MKKQKLALAISLAFSCAAAAQTTTLPSVVITANPVIEEVRVDAFSSVSAVVTQDQLRDQNAVDLASALRRTPGVEISRFNPVGAFGGAEGGAIFIRGMGGSRPGSEIKTYIDGLPFYMGVWNHPLLDLLPVNGMQSITVYKSPQPQINGNNFRLPDLEGNPDGTLDQSKGHFCSGFRMREFLLGEFVQESGDGTIMDRTGHPVNLDGQCVGGGVGLDISSRNEQLANERARLVLVLQVVA